VLPIPVEHLVTARGYGSELMVRMVVRDEGGGEWTFSAKQFPKYDFLSF